MKLYIKQKVFSWNDKFTVYDEYGYDRYYVEGEFFSFGKKLHVYDLNGREVAFIEQKVMSFLPRFFVYVNGAQVAEIVKQFTFFRPKYSIDGLGWNIEGSFWAHDYEITQNGRPIVTIMKEWMTWGDCYELNIANPQDEIVALAVVLTIDCVMAAQQAAAST
ncbi:MAG: LURP-one-related family protein [Clostridia bacterium]|nr:LURP-one-related family protein [Clostridia bacterium]